jgi:hypothetical protein
MEANEPLCPDCQAPHGADDNYCRECGMFLAIERLPAKREPASTRALQVSRAGLPVPVAKVATAVAIGTALQLGAGLAGKFLMRQAGKQAVRSLRPAHSKSSRPAVVSQVVQEPAETGMVAAVSETVLIRRVWIRRG